MSPTLLREVETLLESRLARAFDAATPRNATPSAAAQCALLKKEACARVPRHDQVHLLC